MNCQIFQQNAALYMYDELPDDLRHLMELHAKECAKCQEELGDLVEMRGRLAMVPLEEPSASMLAAARMRLQEMLEQSAPASHWSRFVTLDLAGWMHQMRFSPALAAVLVIAGFAGGAMTSYRLGVRGGTAVVTPGGAAGAQEASIAGISGITQDANDPRQVHISFDRVLPDQAQGSLDDPKIQQLLLYAAQSNRNSGVRLDSISVLSQNPQDNQVREALIYAVRYDKNPGVRLKALEGLKDFVATDTRVRDALLDALVNDTNPGVRTEAINLLQPVRADTTVRQTFQALAAHDKDTYIRTASRRMLASLPEFE